MVYVRVMACAGLIALAGCGDAGSDAAARAPAVPATSVKAPALAVNGTTPVPVSGHPEPLSLLESADPVLARNKRLVFDFWRGVVNGGQVELADELLAETYIQHSPLLRTGRSAFKEIFSVVPRRDPVPDLVSPPLVALVAEGELVVMALAEEVADREGAGTYMTTHFNLFRIEEGRLAEHWHSVQTPPGPDVPAPENGGPQPISGAEGAAQYALLQAAGPVLAANKRLVFDTWRQIVDAGREEMTELYVHPDYIEHGVSALSGREGFRAHHALRADAQVASSTAEPLVAMVAEGDLVVQVLKLEHPHPSRAGATYTTARFDMFRVADGRLAEHWDGTVKVIAPAAAQQEIGRACPSEDGIEFVCGPTNAEDLLQIGTTHWLLASGMAGEVPGIGASQGKLHLVDSRDRRWSLLFPGSSARIEHDTGLYPQCPGPIDTQDFSAHGLALQNFPQGTAQYRLYMTSHGAREAIEVFLLDVTDAPALTWIGCVPLPANVWANSVTILRDGGFMATNFMDPAVGFAPIMAGEINGAVLEWHPGSEVRVLPGTELSGPNGIALSDDERFLYVAAFGSDTVVRYDLSASPASRQEVRLDIAPDNLRWSGDGTLYTAGGNSCPGGSAAPCAGWSVWEIAADTLAARRVAGVNGSAVLPSVSSALLVGDEIWVGTPRGDKLGIVRK